jgi:hypothetical protein
MKREETFQKKTGEDDKTGERDLRGYQSVVLFPLFRLKKMIIVIRA